jgi:hypothetical protein
MIERFGASTSESIAVTLAPALLRSTAREAVTEDFPTPPFPLTTAISFKGTLFLARLSVPRPDDSADEGNKEYIFISLSRMFEKDIVTSQGY